MKPTKEGLILPPSRQVEGLEFGALPEIRDKELFQGSVAMLLDVRQMVDDEISFNRELPAEVAAKLEEANRRVYLFFAEAVGIDFTNPRETNYNPRVRNIQLEDIPQPVFAGLVEISKLPEVHERLFAEPREGLRIETAPPYHLIYEIYQKALRRMSEAQVGRDDVLLQRIEALNKKEVNEAAHIDRSLPFPVEMKDVTIERMQISCNKIAEIIEDRREFLPEALRTEIDYAVSFLRSLAAPALRIARRDDRTLGADELSFFERIEGLLEQPERLTLGHLPEKAVEVLSKLGYLDHYIHLAILGHDVEAPDQVLDASGRRVTTLERPHAYNPFAIAAQNTLRLDEEGLVPFMDLKKLDKLLLAGNGHNVIEVVAAHDMTKVARLVRALESDDTGLVNKAWRWIAARWRDLFRSREEQLERAEEDRLKRQMNKHSRAFRFPKDVLLSGGSIKDADSYSYGYREAVDILAPTDLNVKDLLLETSRRICDDVANEPRLENPVLMKRIITAITELGLDADLSALLQKKAARYEPGGSFEKDKSGSQFSAEVKDIIENMSWAEVLDKVCADQPDLFKVIAFLRHLINLMKTDGEEVKFKFVRLIELLERYAEKVDPELARALHKKYFDTYRDASVEAEEMKSGRFWVHQAPGLMDKVRTTPQLLEFDLNRVQKAWEEAYYFPDAPRSVVEKRGYQVQDTLRFRDDVGGLITFQVLPTTEVVCYAKGPQCLEKTVYKPAEKTDSPRPGWVGETSRYPTMVSGTHEVHNVCFLPDGSKWVEYLYKELTASETAGPTLETKKHIIAKMDGHEDDAKPIEVSLLAPFRHGSLRFLPDGRFIAQKKFGNLFFNWQPLDSAPGNTSEDFAVSGDHVDVARDRTVYSLTQQGSITRFRGEQFMRENLMPENLKERYARDKPIEAFAVINRQQDKFVGLQPHDFVFFSGGELVLHRYSDRPLPYSDGHRVRLQAGGEGAPDAMMDTIISQKVFFKQEAIYTKPQRHTYTKMKKIIATEDAIFMLQRRGNTDTYSTRYNETTRIIILRKQDGEWQKNEELSLDIYSEDMRVTPDGKIYVSGKRRFAGPSAVEFENVIYVLDGEKSTVER